MAAVSVDRISARVDGAILDELARIHREEIHEGFLSSLGTGVLKQLYRALASSDAVRIFLARNEEGQILGFICGSLDTSKAYRDVLLRSPHLLLPPLLPHLFSLRTIKKITETLLYPKKKTTSDLPNSEILNFCVTKAAQGRGVGKQLFYGLIEELEQCGIDRIKIVTGASQESARNFYISVGATLQDEIEVHHGTKSHIFEYSRAAAAVNA